MNKMLLAVGVVLVGAIVVAVLVFVLLFVDGAGDGQGEGSLRVALQSFSAETLDPSLDTQDGLRYHGYMYDHLAGVNADGMLDSGFGLVSAWAAAPDAKSYTLTLRENAKWHDGKQVAADDVRASLEYYFREGAVCGVCGNLSGAIQGVDVVDDRDAVIRLNEPNVVFMGLLAPVEGDVPLLPAHVIDGDGASVFADKPVGAGPWKFASRLQGDYVEYEANTDYWDAQRVSQFGTLRISLVPDEGVRMALLEAGDIDVTPIVAASVGDAKGNGFAVDGPKHVVSTTMRFAMSYDPGFLTSSLDFRKALAVSVDMPKIIGALYPPEAATAAKGSALFTPVSPGYEAILPPYEYDPQQAEQLLEQAGYAGEPVKLLSLVAYGLSEMPIINEMVAEQWRDVGINAEVVSAEWPSLQPLFLSRPQQFEEYGVAPVLHGAAPTRPGGDINGIRRYISGADGAMLTYFAPSVGDAMLSQVSLVVEDADRTVTLRALNRKTYGEYWALPVMWRHDTYAISPALTGWQPTNGTSSDLRFETLQRAP